MKKIVSIVGGAAVACTTAGLMLAGSTFAVGAEPTNCADAVVALNEANVNQKAAVDADKAAADAKKADDALARAKDKKTDADTAESQAASDVDVKQDAVDALDKDGDGKADVAGDQAKLDNALVALAEAKKTLADRTRDAEDADKALADAQKLADKTDAGDLQDEADKTDVVATQRALDEARADFNRECTEGNDAADVTTTPPTPTATPAPVTPAPVEVPTGPVDTGGGPA